MDLQVPPNCDLTLGMTCVEKSVPGETQWRVLVDERFLNPVGVVQGGFLTAMLDSAMGASVVTALEPRRVVVANTNLQASFLRPVKPGEQLTVTARVQKLGRSVAFLAGIIVNDRGACVVTASSTYLIKER